MKIEHLHTLVVGGGTVGLEKLTALLANAPQARITLVAVKILPGIKKLAIKSPNLELLEKAFAPEDLRGKNLAIIATNDHATNVQVHQASKEAGVLVNVADTPALCDFYLGSIVQKGSLKIAISTNGQSPTIAKRLREVLSDSIPDEMENVLSNLKMIRDKLKGNFSQKVSKLNEITSVLVEK